MGCNASKQVKSSLDNSKSKFDNLDDSIHLIIQRDIEASSSSSIKAPRPSPTIDNTTRTKSSQKNEEISSKKAMGDSKTVLCNDSCTLADHDEELDQLLYHSAHRLASVDQRDMEEFGS